MKSVWFKPLSFFRIILLLIVQTWLFSYWFSVSFHCFFNDFIVFRVICHPVMMISCLSADILNIPFASICVHLKSIFTSIQFLFCFLLICSCSAFNCIHFSSLPSAVSGHICLFLQLHNPFFICFCNLGAFVSVLEALCVSLWSNSFSVALILLWGYTQ